MEQPRWGVSPRILENPTFSGRPRSSEPLSRTDIIYAPRNRAPGSRRVRARVPYLAPPPCVAKDCVPQRNTKNEFRATSELFHYWQTLTQNKI